MQHSDQPEQPAAVNAGRLRAVAFWHAWSALMVAPVLLVLLLTGAAYLFDREFDALWYQQAYQTQPVHRQTGAPLQAASLQQQQDFLRQQFPHAQLQRVILPPDWPADGSATADSSTTAGNRTAVSWQLQQQGPPLLVYLDPYQLQINATEDPTRSPMALIRRLHGELLAGTDGAYLIEWVSCWTLLLLLTGAWLWWPRRPDGQPRGVISGLAGVLWPRRRRDGSIHWRDWHAIPALFSSLALAFLVLTGLPWSVFWGEQFASLSAQLSQVSRQAPSHASTQAASQAASPWSGPAAPAASGWAWLTPSPNFHLPAALSAMPTADPHAAHRQMAVSAAEVAVTDGQLAWSDRQWPVPASQHRHGLADISVVEPWLTRLPLAQFGPGVRLMYPGSSGAPFTISYVPDQAQGQRTLYIDAVSGQLLADIGWQQYSLAAKVVEWGVMVHLGRQYGVLNQLVNLLFCLLAVGALLAGLRLWWQRRSSGRWLPLRQRADRLPKRLQAALLVLVLLFPLLLAAVVLQLFLRLWLLRQRLRPGR